MDRAEIKTRVLEIVRPLARAEGISEIEDSMSILDDLKVNSARVVDLILEFEDQFEIEILDEEADEARTVGELVDLVMRKLGG